MTDFEKTRAFFELPDDVIYLDGNSLGPLPRGASDRLQKFLHDEWGKLLIRGWNQAGWIDLPSKLGNRLSALIGAPHGTVSAGDTLSIKLFQALSAALALRPDRKTVLSDTGNFPSDLYIAEGLLRLMGDERRLKTVAPESVECALDDDVAVLMLTEIDYRTSRRHDMKALTSKAHAVGALTVWDLAHSAGAVPVNVVDCEADFAVGCTYKYLNGGPGAPAFIYVSSEFADSAQTAIQGWLGHAAPFQFTPEYHPAPAVQRMRVGTPGISGLIALDVALDVWQFASIQDVHAQSMRLSQEFIDRLQQACPQLKLISPRNPDARGGHVSFSHPHGYPIVQALIENGVIGDFREPDVLRFGIAPLYNSFEDIQRAVERFETVVAAKPWENSAYSHRLTVT